MPPILVRQIRNGIEERVHRGDIVEVDAAGRMIRALGDVNRPVTLRSTVKPFGLVALVEAGGIEAFDLEPSELAIMASSHSGEDVHVRTLQGVFRRAGVSQSLLGCGIEGMPLDALTATRLARDGEQPGPIRHMCSGQHSVFLLLSRLKGWDPAQYWTDGHPAQVAYRAAVAPRRPSCGPPSMAAGSRRMPSRSARSPAPSRCWRTRPRSRRRTRAARSRRHSPGSGTRCSRTRR